MIKIELSPLLAGNCHYSSSYSMLWDDFTFIDAQLYLTAYTELWGTWHAIQTPQKENNIAAHLDGVLLPHYL